MEFELLSKLLPHEISKYVIETLDTRLDNGQANNNLNKLSDHRSLFINRNVLTQNSSDQVMKGDEQQDFGSCSASCRIGSNSLVLG